MKLLFPILFITLLYAQPKNLDLFLFESKDGIRFGNQRDLKQKGRMPAVVMTRHGKVFLYYLNQKDLMVMTGENEGGRWNLPQKLHIEKMPADLAELEEPTAIILPSGKIRLFFSCRDQNAKNKALYSALSDDGITFTFEPGKRFAVPNHDIVQSFLTNKWGTWHLYCLNLQRPGYAFEATSRNGLHFTRVLDSHFTKRAHMGGGTITRHKSRLLFYATNTNFQYHWVAQSSDGHRWRAVKNFVLPKGNIAVSENATGKILLVTAAEKKWIKLPKPVHLVQNKKEMSRLDKLKEQHKKFVTKKGQEEVLKRIDKEYQASDYTPRVKVPKGEFNWNDFTLYKIKKIPGNGYSVTFVDRAGRIAKRKFYGEDARLYDNVYKIFVMCEKNELLKPLLEHALKSLPSMLKKKKKNQ